MSLARRTLKTAIMNGLSLATNFVVSHVQGMISVSLPTADFSLSAILEIVQAGGFIPVILKIGTTGSFSYVTFATAETFAEMGQGGHGKPQDRMPSALQTLFQAGGLNAEGIPLAQIAAEAAATEAAAAEAAVAAEAAAAVAAAQANSTGPASRRTRRGNARSAPVAV